MAQEEKKPIVAPYVPWSTFYGLIQSLRKDMPAAIDRSVLRDGRSGQQAYELDTGLRFLGLKNADDTPTELLKQLVTATDEAATLREVLVRAYEPKLKLAALKTMTPALIQQHLSQFGNTGSTLRKARKFILEAARAAGVELSPRLKVRAMPARRARGPGKPRRAKAELPSGRDGAAGSGPTAREVGLLEEILKRHKDNPEGLDQWLEGVLYMMRKEMTQQA
ncbi:MAG: hypothetical protein AUH78_23285 [Gemmatimonadetes bacterium 13_1_40CM_4_69_8]|nr:MAG: hypothetical protein AUH78_23285 [Gemmatimonadetes bacterium 13_1_40CM_4_69_8]